VGGGNNKRRKNTSSEVIERGTAGDFWAMVFLKKRVENWGGSHEYIRGRGLKKRETLGAGSSVGCIGILERGRRH